MELQRYLGLRRFGLADWRTCLRVGTDVRGSNIWVPGSRDYRAFEDYLLPAEAGRDTGIDGETVSVGLMLP